ncbi:MAG: murein biosynthesis integral membrane protein MurJ [Atopobiaceae bacterium]|nr:murein biosynthesis integral membrane protein MurJ [Atopobiaceae bacterium]
MTETLEETQEQDSGERTTRAESSAALMSVLVVISRLTGFARTWAQAYAMGATVLASCYEVANNLPTQIYELVTAGMLVTAFLPVYLSVKKRLGQKGANDYVSNLTSIVVLLTGAVTLVSIIFAAQIIWTQSFSAAEGFDAPRAVWFFRFFAIEIVLYALSTIFQGVVNAERDYLWTFLAPIFNNLVVMGSFLSYSVLADTNLPLALLILAIGNPLGVLVQALLQIPSMRKHGVRLRFRVNLKDPALRDTLTIGVPSIVLMVLGFVTNSFHLNAFLTFTPIGASIGSYSMLWYNLPYAIFCVPIMTVLFTEMADFYASGDMDSFLDTVVSGTNKILILLIPFAFYLAVFSTQLVTIVSASRFDAEAAELCAYYLSWRALSLPVYGVAMLFQKVCSSTRRMDVLVWVTVLTSALQIALVLWVAPLTGLWMVPFSSFVFYFVTVVAILLYLKKSYGRIAIGSIVKSAARSTVLGFVGAMAAVLIIRFASPLLASFGGPVIQALLTCVVAGIPAVVVTYGLAVALHVPEASAVTTVINRLLRRA